MALRLALPQPCGQSLKLHGKQVWSETHHWPPSTKLMLRIDISDEDRGHAFDVWDDYPFSLFRIREEMICFQEKIWWTMIARIAGPDFRVPSGSEIWNESWIKIMEFILVHWSNYCEEICKATNQYNNKLLKNVIKCEW